MTDAATIGNAQQPQGGGFGGRPVHRTAEVWSFSSRRAWIEIGVCSVPATAWMSLSLFMSSVLRTCGTVSFNDNPRGENEFMGARGVSDAQDSSRSACHNPSQARRSRIS